MAQVMLAETTIRLTFEAGMNDKGESIYRTKSLNNVKKESTADQLFQVAQAISVLCNDPLNSVLRFDSSEIIG
ncbi:DUF1659 domain-containing protein [Neobacillus sp. PS3-40]|jgi:hypothetical protein|uniref:DUF1659 domain-containing protein n=1 Tax=Neobacillus sp. PS3-40 TaxID=3070679 RepID=UPI0027DFB08C|nr:DUF1659 domain-containing protein [Neobacillus sp. PS3-40]WML44055.1 DUF1659 domain-containing protein [Neobacillus sp. PS3-40]